jgi:hypothetical protein
MSKTISDLNSSNPVLCKSFVAVGPYLLERFISHSVTEVRYFEPSSAHRGYVCFELQLTLLGVDMLIEHETKLM